jgi:hypothetical protein
LQQDLNVIEMKKPELEFSFQINVDIAAGKVKEAGMTGKGLRRIVPIMGGSFEGGNIRGKVLPGGYDWQLLRSDQVTELDARYLLETDDGALITIVNQGLRHGPPEVMQRLANGEQVDPADYYFRAIPVFETGSKKYDWLTKHIFITTCIRNPDKVIVRVWKLC